MTRSLRVVGLAGALAFLLTACTLTVRPGETTASVTGPNVIVWGHLGVSFGFPGLVVISRNEGPHHLYAVFQSHASLYGAFLDVDRRMRDDGWHRLSYRQDNGDVFATYERGDREAHVVIRREDREGRYRMSIDD